MNNFCLCLIGFYKLSGIKYKNICFLSTNKNYKKDHDLVLNKIQSLHVQNLMQINSWEDQFYLQVWSKILPGKC